MDNIIAVGDIVKLTSIGIWYYFYSHDNLFEVISFDKVSVENTVVTVQSIKDRIYLEFYLKYLVHTNQRKFTKEEKINNKIKQLEERFSKRQQYLKGLDYEA